jgi:hypothetical protein
MRGPRRRCWSSTDPDLTPAILNGVEIARWLLATARAKSDDRLVTTRTLYVSASTVIVFSSPRAASSRKRRCYGLDAVELVRDSDA